MYFYKIEVYHPLLGSERIIMRHADRFDNHQLNIIVQEAFDECIEKYCNKPLLERGEEACRMEVETIFEKCLPLQLKNHGFKSIKINATCSIWELKDRLNQTRAIVSVYDLPDSIAEEIIDYSLKLIEEGEMK